MFFSHTQPPVNARAVADFYSDDPVLLNASVGLFNSLKDDQAFQRSIQGKGIHAVIDALHQIAAEQATARQTLRMH